MKLSALKRAALAAGVVSSTFIGVTTGQAQAVDSLLDKLVDKGVLTSKEAGELREESDRNFTKAYQVKSGMPDWVTALKINGDFRGRYDGIFFDNDVNTRTVNPTTGAVTPNAAVDRSRFRYRFRLGLTAVMAENFEVGLRLTSSDPSGSFGGDPISGNSSFQDNGSKKFIYVDLAYGKWSFLNSKPANASITVGKMENPFASELLYDNDYTPEGAGLAGTFRFGDVHSIKVGAGAFMLDEISLDSSDPYLLGAQVKWDAAWTKRLNTSLGAGIMSIQNVFALTNGAVPNVQRGNSRSLVGTNSVNAPAYFFNPLFVTGSIGYTLDEVPFYSGAFPITLMGEYVNNPGADASASVPGQAAYNGGNQAWTAGITFGKAGKKKTWEVSYRYRYLGANFWYEEFVDSDFGATYQSALARSDISSSSIYGAGTNVRGHLAKASYSPNNALTLSVSYALSTLIQAVPSGSESQTGRLIVDAVLKF